MWVRIAAVLALAIAATTAADEARADDSVYSPPWPAAPFSSRRPPPTRGWYGWQTLSIDLAVLAALYASGRYESDAVAYAALGTYVLAPPLVHSAHGRLDAAGGSLALRVGAPLALGATMHVVVSCHRTSHTYADAPPSKESGCGAGPFAFGAVLGSFTAMIVDMAILGFPPQRGREHTAVVAPRVRIDSRGARASVTVRF
jgi:hypothetical protein